MLTKTGYVLTAYDDWESDSGLVVLVAGRGTQKIAVQVPVGIDDI